MSKDRTLKIVDFFVNYGLFELTELQENEAKVYMENENIYNEDIFPIVGDLIKFKYIEEPVRKPIVPSLVEQPS